MAPTSGNKENTDTPTPSKPTKKVPKAKKLDKKKSTHGPHAKWTSANDATLIHMLKDQQAKENQADNNWNAVVWTETEKALAGSEEKTNSGVKKAKGCNDQWSLLQSQTLTLQKMHNELSGWGWDNIHSMLVADDEAWDTYIKAHPEAAMFCSKPFPLLTTFFH
ncbi:hypothetical protein DXG03_001259 [Asterophora parasitica]|uniref:Myb/SANT-like domain-containing protein n=1 Tax=Asterophora parasitica TaxID=117018 RepID=A0A9P7FXD5_9AGAR|nr:hypothetical protein DXG03_001259 [Asterophora parasitica]